MAKAHYDKPPSEKQKKRFAKYLSEDEELIIATGFGKTYLRSRAIYWILLPGFIFMAAFFGYAYYYELNIAAWTLYGLIVATLFALLKAFWTYHANRYVLTTRRVIVKRGMFNVKLMSALYDKITHIEVDQSFLDKLLMHHGTVIIHTAGSNKDELTLAFIEYPIEFKNILERLINRERRDTQGGSTPLVEVEGEIVE
jgi:uncharacterized membrane protein YdbT with pleckstrin-like domain